MRDLVQEFCDAYHDFNDISPGRRVQQMKVLRLYEDFVGVPLDQTQGTDFADFLAYLLSEQELAPTTVRLRGNMVRVMYGWMYDRKLIDANLLMDVQRVRNPRGANDADPKPYSRKELRQFWADLDEAYPHLTQHRMQRWSQGRLRYYKLYFGAMRLQLEAMISLALYCGLRRNEIFNLSIDDMHPLNQYVVVRHGKAGPDGRPKFREVPHTPQSRKAVEEWLTMRRILDPPHDQPWLCLAYNGPVSRRTQPLSFRRFAELLQFGQSYRWHRFRHTCATEWLRSGMKLELVSRLLGHASTEQTLAYCKLVRDDIYKAVDRYGDDFHRAVRPNDTAEAA